MKTHKPHTLADVFKTDTIADGPMHHRIETALRRLDEAQSPLRANPLDQEAVTGGGSHSDPVASLAQQHIDHGDPHRETRNRLQTLILQRHEISKAIANICSEWAPPTAPTTERPTTNLVIWCSNHLVHHVMEPRASDGSQFCGWCRNIKSQYGKLPTKELIDLHSKRGRIDDATYRKLLGRGKVA